MQERTLEFLNNEVNKLTADNEYLDRQIVFLTDRLKNIKQTREENGKTIADLKYSIDALTGVLEFRLKAEMEIIDAKHALKAAITAGDLLRGL